MLRVTTLGKGFGLNRPPTLNPGAFKEIFFPRPAAARLSCQRLGVQAQRHMEAYSDGWSWQRPGSNRDRIAACINCHFGCKDWIHPTSCATSA